MKSGDSKKMSKDFEKQKSRMLFLIIGVVIIMTALLAFNVEGLLGIGRNIQTAFVSPLQTAFPESQSIDFYFPSEGYAVQTGDFNFRPYYDFDNLKTGYAVVHGNRHTFVDGQSKNFNGIIVSFKLGNLMEISRYKALGEDEAKDIEAVQVYEHIYSFKIDVDKILSVDYKSDSSYVLNPTTSRVLDFDIINSNGEFEGILDWRLDPPFLMKSSISDSQSIVFKNGINNFKVSSVLDQIGTYSLKVTPRIVFLDEKGGFFDSIRGSMEKVSIEVQPKVLGEKPTDVKLIECVENTVKHPYFQILFVGVLTILAIIIYISAFIIKPRKKKRR